MFCVSLGFGFYFGFPFFFSIFDFFKTTEDVLSGLKGSNYIPFSISFYISFGWLHFTSFNLLI